MGQHLAQITLVVNDYDEAISFYTKALGFDLVEDTTINASKRWVVVSPKGNGNCNLLLAKALDDEQMKAVGNQTGGRVSFFLYTDEFWEYYNTLLNHNVTIIREPQEQDYGIVAVFADCYGNKWDLIEPNA